jgi:hypothetical protein
VKLGESATGTYDLLKKIYGDECPSRTEDFGRFKRLEEEREEIGDNQHPSCTSTTKTEANIKKVIENVQEKRCLSIRAVAELINIDKELFDRFYITIST